MIFCESFSCKKKDFNYINRDGIKNPTQMLCPYAAKTCCTIFVATEISIELVPCFLTISLAIDSKIIKKVEYFSSLN